MNRAEVLLGTTLESRYRLDAVVREAPDFLVFQGHDLQRNARVEVRIARALRAMAMEELLDAVDAFAAEAEQLRQLSNASTHTERLLASGQHDGPDREHLAYCVFAHVEGVPLSLAHPRASPPIPLADAVTMLEPVATALATAHGMGVFHGDVRPDNMIVGGSTITLIGFTRATRFGSGAARAFSPAYGAPEHFRRAQGERGVGPATDTYALALCVVELVTGQPALMGSSQNDLYREATDIAKRPTLRARGASVSEAVEGVIARAVAVNPKLRWPSVHDFWAALTQAASVKAPPPRPAPTARPAPRRRTMIAVVATVAVIGVVMGMVARRRPAVSPPAPVASPSASATVSAVATASASAPSVVAPATPEGMIRIPAGTFTMGKDEAGKGDRPAHHVALTHAFYIDRTEVTIDKYGACVEKGSCTPRIVHLRKNSAGGWGCNLDDDHGSYPANCVDRKQAIAYCDYAAKRLPTEAEWEYAARGSDERDYPWGNGAPKSCSLAVLSGMTGGCGARHGTSPVGTAPDGASPFGVLDMGGNVWEWVADDYAAYSSSDVTDPVVTITDRSEQLRGILRGGSWDYGPESAKTTYRLPFIAEAGNASTGIRCALSE